MDSSVSITAQPSLRVRCSIYIVPPRPGVAAPAKLACGIRRSPSRRSRRTLTSCQRLQVSCQRTTQNKADDRDDECSEKRREEFVDAEPKTHALSNPTGQKQHECVDDENEQAQGDDFQW